MERETLPLAAYGAIGDCWGAALVGRNGSADWACVERFDRPPVFAGLLDGGRGGSWRIGPPAVRAYSRQQYRPGTAVLETTHETGNGSARVVDAFLPAGGGAFVRLCEGLSGSVELRSTFEPTSDYGREALKLEQVEGGLHGNGLRVIGQEESSVTFELRPSERRAFVLAWGCEPRLGDAEQLVDDTAGWWRAWSEGCGYEGPYRAAVVRSAITLKLLTYEPTGAVVAAPTTSLPERIGGDRNWDYRYAWLRDAAMTLFAWYALGRREEGDAFFDWICARLGDSGELRVMYDVDGGSDHDERELGWLDGYCGSRPVRVGNAACRQTQLDVYGEVLECFSTACAWGRSDKLSLWSRYRALADWVCAHWHEPDSGIWELRGRERHYVHSKVMAWLAVDRALSAAAANSLPAPVVRWQATRDAIRAWVLEHGWHARLQAFRQSADSDEVDAANVLVPLVGFLPADDPRSRSNLDRIVAELGEDGLLHRFRADEGAFTTCSFWLVSALAWDGRTDAAAATFERLLGRASPLGLYAEELEPSTGALLGNMPQAFPHAALITAAVNLARSSEEHGVAPASADAPAGAAHLVPRRESYSSSPT